MAGTVIPVDEVPFDEANVAQLPILLNGFPSGSVIEDTDNVTGPVNAPIGFTAITDDSPVIAPADTPKLFDSAATVKLPVCRIAWTLQDVSLPFESVPTIVTIDVPAAVPAGAVRVSVLFGLAEETVAALRPAVAMPPVTGSGDGVATSDTLAVKPGFGSSVIVLVTPVADPIGTTTVSGLSLSQKLASKLT